MDNEVSNITIYAWNFRGFRYLEVPLSGTTFLVGDNSSGKSSILHLLNCVLNQDLQDIPSLNESISVGRYDYFSPYFNNADVTFGYEGKYEGKRIGKIVTVKHNPRYSPSITRCSYISNDTLVTIKQHGKSLRYRHSTLEEETDFSTIFDLHIKEKGFSNLARTRIDQGRTAPNSPIAVVEYANNSNSTDSIIDVLQASLPPARHTAPVRGLPERFYNHKRTLTPSGKHFAVMWNDMRFDNSKSLDSDVDKFGKESGLFEEVKVDPVNKKEEDAPLIVKILKQGKYFFLDQVGIGISQVVPILVETVYAKRRKHKHIMLFQQPELHLHPIAQASLGTFFYNSLYKHGGLIIETHSNYLIDRFRSEIRDTADEKSNARILFCKNTNQGNVCENIAISTKGEMENPPKEYFSFFVSELGRTMF